MLPIHDYLVHVSRAHDDRRRHHFWPILLNQPLPVIAIPLRSDDLDAILDLQAAFSTAYQRGAYQMDIDYTSDPRPPLTQEQRVWARAVVAENPEGKSKA